MSHYTKLNDRTLISNKNDINIKNEFRWLMNAGLTNMDSNDSSNRPITPKYTSFYNRKTSAKNPSDHSINMNNLERGEDDDEVEM